MEKSKNFSNEVILFSNDEIQISVWKKNRKKICMDCGTPIFRGAKRCSKCYGKIFGGCNRKVNDIEKFKELFMNPEYLYADIAKFFDISYTTINRWRKKLNLPQKRKIPHHTKRPKGLKYNKRKS